MQTLNLAKLGKYFVSGRDTRSGTERLLNNLKHSNYGLSAAFPEAANTAISPKLDSFQITENISELLSPSCGMTEEEKQKYMAKIIAKLKSGQKLTAEEMRFLQAESPALYQQAARVEAMRDALENRLKHCSSKNEATEIFSDAMSHISDDDPMKEYLVAAYQKVMSEYKDSREYQTLPQESEETKKISATDTEEIRKSSMSK